MPKMDGEETFKKLRKLDPCIPVVLWSGYNEQDVESRFKGKGKHVFIQKPFQISDLVEAIKAVLDPPEK
ncbi:hypothetical protein AUK22_05200 [bacterium CG2_30_54_10]|nr:MAG: hypothetical protein AUK22_05200 [bacterium CG2_30_54_10]